MLTSKMLEEPTNQEFPQSNHNKKTVANFLIFSEYLPLLCRILLFSNKFER